MLKAMQAYPAYWFVKGKKIGSGTAPVWSNPTLVVFKHQAAHFMLIVPK